MGALAGLLGGVGLLLLWLGFTTPPATPRTRRRMANLREVLAQAGLSGVRPLHLIALSVGGGLLVFGVAVVSTDSITIAAAFACFAAYGPYLLVRRLRQRRRSELRELWPEVVDNLTSGIRAGLSLPEALGALGDRGPESLRDAFAGFGRDYRATGSFNASLDRLKATLADPVGDRICESLRVAREVGGTNLGHLLTTLGEFLRDDARTRAELLARQSWSVSAARLAVSAPWLILVLLSTRSEALSAYDTPAGIAIIAVGAAVCVLAYRIMMTIGRLPEDRRVLR